MIKSYWLSWRRLNTYNIISKNVNNFEKIVEYANVKWTTNLLKNKINRFWFYNQTLIKNFFLVDVLSRRLNYKKK